MCFPWQQQSAQLRANEAVKQLGFAFLSYLEKGARSLSVFYNCGRYFAGYHCLRIEDFFSLIKRKYTIFRQALLGCSILQQNERSSGLPV